MSLSVAKGVLLSFAAFAGGWFACDGIGRAGEESSGPSWVVAENPDLMGPARYALLSLLDVTDICGVKRTLRWLDNPLPRNCTVEREPMVELGTGLYWLLSARGQMSVRAAASGLDVKLRSGTEPNLTWMFEIRKRQGEPAILTQTACSVEDTPNEPCPIDFVDSWAGTDPWRPIRGESQFVSSR